MGTFSSAMILQWWVDNALRSLSVATVAGLLLLVLRIRDANIRHRTWSLVLVTMMVLPVLCSLLPEVESPIWLPAIGGAEGEAAPVPRRSDFIATPIAARYVKATAASPVVDSLASRYGSESATLPVAEQSTVSTRFEKPPLLPSAGEPFSWATIAVAVYVASAAAILTRILTGVVLTRRMARRGRRLTPLDHTAFTGEVPIVESPEIQTPATVGIWGPVILLPKDWRTWNTDTLKLAISHETFHVRRRDALVALVANVNVALHWLNPLAWFLRWRLADLAERVCDDEVLRTHGDHAEYAETLLAMASRLTKGERVSPLVVPMARHSQVETRIEAIIDDERPLCRRLGWRGATLLLTLAVPVIACIAALQPASYGQPRASATGQRPSVSRKAERVADERATADRYETTNPTSPGQPGASATEQTTNLAGRKRERPELNAEAAEEAKVAEANGRDDVDSPRYMIVYPLDGNEADIKSWLKAVELASEVRLTTKDGKDMAVVIGTREEHERVSGLLQSKRAETSSSLFPTLEDQRAADQAYKLLGVELEKLSSEERERVKAKGYQGGLRVTSQDNPMHGLRTHDLLVGLHVWPTESLAQVTAILQRDDLDQLTPLKFYVIRRGSESGIGEGGFSSGAATGPDHVVTGRISVELDAWRAVREANAANPVLKTFDTILVVAYDEKEMIRTGEEVPIINDAYSIDEDGTVNFGPPYGKVHIAGKTFGEAAKIIQKHLSAKIANCAVKVAPEPQSPSFKAPPEYIPTPAYPGPAPNPFSSDQSTLLYDGKTFDHWRQAWRQDLSPEYRIQAVRAFVAFANASEGQQAEAAVHEILQIAEQYDWSTIGRNQLIQPLQEACTAAFNEQQIPDQLAIEAIITFPNAAKNKKFLSFFQYILPQLAQSYPEGNKALRYAFPDLEIPAYVSVGESPAG